MTISAVINNPIALIPPPPLNGPGSIWNWGVNNNGELGDGTTTTRTVPTVQPGGHLFTKTSSSQANTLGLKQDGTMWAWGYNNQSRLGVAGGAPVLSPTQVAVGTTFIDISVASEACVALDSNGYPWGVGNNTTGVLGNLVGTLSTWTQLSFTQQFTKIDCAIDQSVFGMTAALKSNGEIWAWAVDAGLGGPSSTTPTLFSLGGDVYTDISTDGLAILGLRGGIIYGRGYNGNGNIGDGTATNRSVFTANISGATFTQFISDNRGTMALANDGSVWGWGVNTTNVHGAAATPNTPVQFFIGPYTMIGQTRDGNVMTGFGLKSNGSLEAWGSNNSYQFGNGSTSAASATVVAAGNGVTFTRIPPSMVIGGGSGVIV